MNFNQWTKDLKDKREAYGGSQAILADNVGISRKHYNQIENGKANASDNLQWLIMKALERLNPDCPLTFIFDYVRVRFPTLDVAYIVEAILQMKMCHMGHEDFGFYSYSEHYRHGEVFVLASPDEDKGVLVELKGQGCRQFESYLNAQRRSWYDFFIACIGTGGVFKRIDLAINDTVGILDIPTLAEKCARKECVSLFRSFEFLQKGELSREEKEGMGTTLYLGSKKSDIYFCIYEKDWEQFQKFGTPLEDTETKNRFEIRLKNDRAYHAINDLICNESPETTAFGIINHYACFLDDDGTESCEDWPINKEWELFLGNCSNSLKLTTKPEPYSLLRTKNWMGRQVAASIKMLQMIDEKNGTDEMKRILEGAGLSEKHLKIVAQATAPIEDVIVMPG